MYIHMCEKFSRLVDVLLMRLILFPCRGSPLVGVVWVIKQAHKKMDLHTSSRQMLTRGIKIHVSKKRIRLKIRMTY